YILWTAVLIWMAFIFSLSAQTASESSSLSDQTIRKVAVFILPDFHNMEKLQQENLVSDLQHIARKTAHMLIYMVLGVLCMLAMFQHSIRMKVRIALAICAGYAATDELHQLFVDGRGAQIIDVCIDSFGALIGIVLVLLILNRYKTKKKSDITSLKNGTINGGCSIF
ncbi:MAG: VanZ family protein, partial [Clostridiales bacterium]|nr:VanZ family protein [Clostridiales bacterium]